MKLVLKLGGLNLNELQFVCERKNVIQGRFRGHDKTYSWYLPYKLQKQIHVGDIEIIDTKGNRNKVMVTGLKYERDAKSQYKSFPYIRGVASWQIQHICRHLKSIGVEYSRERHLKGLVNKDGTSLGVDIAFYINEHLCIIEYNGVHHYNKQSPRYKNFAENMEVKRKWCRQNNVPLLEIPFWWQNDLYLFVDHFIESMLYE